MNGNVNGQVTKPDENEDSDDEDALDDIVAGINPSGFSINDPIPQSDSINGLAVIEILASFVLATIHISILIVALRDPNHQTWIGAPIIGLIAWLYITMLNLIYSLQETTIIAETFISLFYLLYFVIALVALRTEILHPTHSANLAITIAFMVIITVLTLYAITHRKSKSKFAGKATPGTEPTFETKASLWDVATFSWFDSVILKGYKKILDLEDVWDLRPDDLAAATLARFRRAKRYRRLSVTLLTHFAPALAMQIFWAIMHALFIFAGPFFLRLILEYIADPSAQKTETAYLYVVGLLVGSCMQSIFQSQCLFIGRRICVRLRAIIIGEVYAKALRRKDMAGASVTAKDGDDVEQEQARNGQIINLMSVDSFKVSEVCAYLHYIVPEMPLQIIIAIFFLYKLLGWSAIAGVAIFVLLIPANYFVSKWIQDIQKTMMKKTDARMNLNSEVISNIRIIKYFAWEEKFFERIDKTRKEELDALRTRFILYALSGIMWFSSPVFVTLATFYIFTGPAGNDLTAPIAFTALALFNTLRTPLENLPDMIIHVLQAKVSIDRVESFLGEEETAKYSLLKQPSSPDDPVIGFKNATFTWAGQSEMEAANGNVFQLENLNIDFPVGKLSLICAPTGAGKSSILMALLGEMNCLGGSAFLPSPKDRNKAFFDSRTGLANCVAYVAQSAWLLNDTLRNNILFGSEYDEKRYRAVLHACALEKDLEILDNGDETEVGDKGIVLSGGQKQRISLARAIYSNAAHVLLDDCLSAVDAHTAKWIHDKCLASELMQNRTCILVTHSVGLCLQTAAKVVVLDNGKVVADDTPDVVAATGLLGEETLHDDGKDLTTHPIVEDGDLLSPEIPVSDGQIEVSMRQPTIEEQHGVVNDAAKTKKAEDKNKVKAKLVQEETRSVGRVKTEVYGIYAKSVGAAGFWFALCFAFFCQQAFQVSQNLWLRTWAASYETEQRFDGVSRYSSPDRSSGGYADLQQLWTIWTLGSNQTSMMAYKEPVNVDYYLGIYALISLVFLSAAVTRMAIAFAGSLKASRNLYKKLLRRVLYATTRFFDSTPAGRIQNRFSKDMETIDTEVGPALMAFVSLLLQSLTVIVVIVYIMPLFIGAAVLITAIYYAIGVFYLASSRELKRLDSLTRSPIYTSFGEMLNGVTTVRAYADERRFMVDNLKRTDTHNRPFFYLWVANRWLSIRIDFAGALVSFLTALFIMLNRDHIDAGLAGLSLGYALTFSEFILWVVRLSSVCEMNMNSVERIQEYLDIEQEPPAVIEDHRPPKDWPQNGSIEVQKLSLRYAADLDPVLKDVTFDVKSREKIGIVGRTGAGKSTLATALFRFIEPLGGNIIIDGVNIAELGLADLRRNLTIITQDPILFTGTIRNNLDIFDEYSDADIFESLERCQLLSDEPSNVFRNLETAVQEGGKNFSQGQRQLMCLARALLRKPTVLVMDEATASIDHATDLRIQETLREVFAESTILCIAHRLRTVIDYDRILVLDQGRVAEYDSPWNLLQNQDGIFSSMVENSGDGALLHTLAEAAHKKTLLVDV